MKRLFNLLLILLSFSAIGQTAITPADSSVRALIQGKVKTRVLGSQAIKAADVRAALDAITDYSSTRTGKVLLTDFIKIGETNADSAFARAFRQTKNLHIPAGSYNVSTDFVVPVNFVITGEGGQTVITQTSNNKNIFDTQNGVQILGIKLKGFTAAAATDFQKNNGIRVSECQNVNISNCVFEGFQSTGIQVRNSDNVSITDNFVYSGKYTFGNSSDIAFYSNLPSRNFVITGNFCLSNNSQGIWFNALGKDTDGIISNNVCITYNNSLTDFEPITTLVRRHGIETSYGTGFAFRLVVNSNICGNTKLSGIYCTAGSVPSGNVIITNNLCFQNGIDQSNDGTLGAGIYINQQGGNVLCNANMIVDYKGIIGAITMNGDYTADSNFVDFTISNNYIFNSANDGIQVKKKSRYGLIFGNKIKGSTRYDLYYLHTQDTTNGLGGGLQVKSNVITRLNALFPAIFCDEPTTMGYRSEISGNTIIGVDYTINTASYQNTAIYVRRPITTVKNNNIRNFYTGIFCESFIDLNGPILHFIADNNELTDCTLGIVTRQGGAFRPIIVVEGNIFRNVTSPVHGGGGAGAARIGRKLGVNVEFLDTLLPTQGGYTRGDRILKTDVLHQGTSPNRYFITGWIRLTTGTGNVLNTDWFEMRSLTGQ